MSLARSQIGLILTAILSGVIGLVLAARILGQPDAAVASREPGGGSAIQWAFAELLLRQGGASSRTDPVVMTAPDLNTFLARHLKAHRLTLRPLVVRLEAGWLEVAGQTSLRQLFPDSAAGGAVALLPDPLLDLELWVVARGRLIARGGQGEFLVAQTALGRQRVPAGWFWWVLGVDPEQVLSWRVPSIVERVDVETGRLVIRTRPRG